MPAMVLLVGFTHDPAVATIWHSFFSTAKAANPAVFVGLENYALAVDDPVFWRALKNNLWFALGTIPASIALAIMMALSIEKVSLGRPAASQSRIVTGSPSTAARRRASAG